jgi:hypothetical protein
MYPDTVPADCRVARWSLHREIVVDCGPPGCKVRRLEMLNRKSRLDATTQQSPEAITSKLKTFVGWSVMSLAFLTLAKAQTVDDIINKNIEAVGGKEVLSKITSAMFQGTVNAMGNDYPVTVIIVNGKGYKSITSINGSDMIECITDTGGWRLNPLVGQTSAQAIPADQLNPMKAVLYIGGPLVDYKDKGYSAELAGREDVAGQSNYKVHLFDNEGTDVVYYINPQTYLVSKAVAKAKVSGQDATSSDFEGGMTVSGPLQLPDDAPPQPQQFPLRSGRRPA